MTGCATNAVDVPSESGLFAVVFSRALRRERLFAFEEDYEDNGGQKRKGDVSDKPQRHEITGRKVVYRLPGVDVVATRSDVEYRVTDAGGLTTDLYYPPHAARGSRLVAVVVA